VSNLTVQSEEDLYDLKSQAAGLEDMVTRMTQEIAAQQRAAGDDKLAMFRQQSSIVAKKLAQKEEALEVAAREGDSLYREIETLVGFSCCVHCCNADDSS
jgi:predicted  nucleic acid-binding Zn-ribbon protein